MATISKLTKSGVLFVNGSIDEYTLPNQPLTGSNEPLADATYNSQGWTTGTVYTAGSTGAWVFTYAGLQRYSGGARSIALTSGKFYFEVTITNRGSSNYGGTPTSGFWQIGMANSSIAGGYDNFPNIFAYDGSVSGGLTGGTTFGAVNITDTLMFAYDTTANQYWIGKNGTWYKSPTTTGATLSGTGSPQLFIMSGFSGGVSGVAGNFKTTVTYPPPSGFTVLTTAAGSNSVKMKTTANSIQAYSFDEYTLASGGVSQSLKNDGTWQVKSEFDEVSFSSGSISLNGTNQYLTVPTGTAFQYGTGDFTAEAWVYRSAAWTAQNILFGQWSGSTGGTTLSWVVLTSNDTNGYARFALSTNGSNVLTDSISSTVIPLNQWNHIAFVRNGSTFTLYLNGISVVTYSSASALYAATNTISIGASSAATQPFNGYISNVRIVKGTALYTSNFIPPHTSILPAVGNTSLLINCLNSTDFINDYSVNKFNVTNNGSATFSTSSPYLR